MQLLKDAVCVVIWSEMFANHPDFDTMSPVGFARSLENELIELIELIELSADTLKSLKSLPP